MVRHRTWFPHLHCHSDHSIKDGCSEVETYADITSSLGGSSLCITDHGQAAVYARQHFACEDFGIKPIYGMEAYINENRSKPIVEIIERLEVKVKKKVPGAKAKLDKAKEYKKTKFRTSPHSVILARNQKGYENLVKMSTDSWLNGFYYAPRTDFTFLAAHSEGLIYSTACIGGYIPRLVRKDWFKAIDEAKRIRKIFGHKNFFIELMITEYKQQRCTNELMMKLAHEIGSPMIITCDVHYAKPEDSMAQDVLMLMRDKKTIKDKEAGEGVWQFESKDLFWRTLEDVEDTYQAFHADYMPKETYLQAIKNTYQLADEIEKIDFDTSLKLPGVYKEPDFLLRELITKGYNWRRSRGEVPTPGRTKLEYAERIRTEMKVISTKGFSEYFVLLEDICRNARDMGARMGPGRGSAGGSLIAFLLRITDIDPIRFNLLFERFLDASRSDPPDIDLDFSPEHRDGIKTFIQNKFPATATIGSFSTFKPRAILQDVGRVFNLPYKEMLDLTSELGMDADKKTWEEIFDLWPEIRKFSEKNPQAFDVVKTLRGLISHRGKNAAGMLVGPESALSNVPLITESDGSIVTAFADSQGDGVKRKGREITRLGYLKVDILGVRNLNIAPRAVEILSREKGIEVDLSMLPLDDRETLDLATTGNVPGVFQLDTHVSRPILKQVKADNFMDLVMVTALARPGPLKHQVHKLYAKLKKNDDWKEEIHEDLIELLSDSRGLMILQEDVMWVAQVMAGLSKSEANQLRKIISKKHPEAIKLWKDRFIDGGVRNGVDKELLQDTWSKIITFAGYGFCKAHAVAYMITAYNQLYMLAHHPIPYFAATLAETPRGKKTRNEGTRLAEIMTCAMGWGIKVLPPCAMKSSLDFDMDNDQIRYGLSKIKGVSNAAETIIAARPFKTLEELFRKVDKKKANLRVFEALIYSGAFDKIGLEEMPSNEECDLECEDPIEYRNVVLCRYHEIKKSKKEINLYLVSTLRQKERELTGMILSWWGSKDPQAIREDEYLTTIETAKKNRKTTVHVLGEVSKSKVIPTGKGPMAFISLSDETGVLDNIVVWASQWRNYKTSLSSGSITVMRLIKKESQNKRYGKWSYFLDMDGRKQPVESAVRVLRRLG